MISLGRYKRIITLSVGIVLVFTILNDFRHYNVLVSKDSKGDSITPIGSDLKDPNSNSQIHAHLANKASNKRFQTFYGELFKSFGEQKSKIPVLELNKKAENRDPKFLWSFKELLGYLTIDKNQVLQLQSLHQEIFNNLPSKFPKNLYKGSGVVFIGGGQFSWLSLLSIHALRTFGSNSPVELIIPTKAEYEEQLCEAILPPLNAKCVLMYEVLGEEIMKNIEIKGYQYKSLALIASSFDDVLLMDSDNTIVTNPDGFFKANPYKEYGMVLWPDYWLRTTSPYFYDIANITVQNLRTRHNKWPIDQVVEVKDINTVPLHDFQGAIPDLSSESGQLMLRKSDHLKTMLLSLFYNLYGPNFFYKLLSQGQSGEGDKDTFIAAAVKSNETFYQVKSEIQSFGWFEGSDFHGVSMGQRNPIQDYGYFESFRASGKSFEKDIGHYDTKACDLFTIHANFPKMNPYLLWKEHKLFNSKNEEVRLYYDISKFLTNVDDFEMMHYRKMRELLCDETTKVTLQYFQDKEIDKICEFISKHIDFLVENPVV